MNALPAILAASVEPPTTKGNHPMNYEHEAGKITALIAQANTGLHLAEMADIDARIAAEQTALERAEAKRDALAKEHEDARNGRVDVAALADAFRSGGVETKATRNVEAIQADQAGVRAAMGQIQDTIRQLQSDRSRVRGELAQAIGATLARPEDALSARIDAALAEMVACWVDARAMASSFRAPVIGQRVHNLNRIIEAMRLAAPEALRGEMMPSAGLIAAMDKHADLLRKAELRPLRQVDPRSL